MEGEPYIHSYRLRRKQHQEGRFRSMSQGNFNEVIDLTKSCTSGQQKGSTVQQKVEVEDMNLEDDSDEETKPDVTSIASEPDTFKRLQVKVKRLPVEKYVIRVDLSKKKSQLDGKKSTSKTQKSKVNSRQTCAASFGKVRNNCEELANDNIGSEAEFVDGDAEGQEELINGGIEDQSATDKLSSEMTAFRERVLETDTRDTGSVTAAAQLHAPKLLQLLCALCGSQEQAVTELVRMAAAGAGDTDKHGKEWKNLGQWFTWYNLFPTIKVMYIQYHVHMMYTMY